MALKKTVKKRRRAKRTVISMETITEALIAGKTLSAANKRALDRLNAAEKALARQDKQVDMASARVEKARQAVANAKTAATKEKAKARQSDLQLKLKELRAQRMTVVSEQRKAVRLAKGLYKAMQAAQAKMVKDFEKQAKVLEKAADRKIRRRRRTSKKKVAAEA
ncbi:MAG: hypothetical protein ABW076_04555 [Candidatus Thiodiazotropha sp.]